MKEAQFLEYVSSYHDLRPKGGKRFLFWVALAIHAVALIALIVVPLVQVDGDLPVFESMAAFLVRPSSAPPPPPPSAPPRASGNPSPTRPRLLEASFVAPVSIPSALPAEDFRGSGDFGIPGSVEGGIPGESPEALWGASAMLLRHNRQTRCASISGKKRRDR